MKLLFVILLSVCTSVAFANNKLPTKKPISGKPLPCTVTVNKPGVASGVDCYGVLYAEGVFGSCTVTAASCETAFIDASSCSSGKLDANIAAIHRREKSKCIGTIGIE